MRKAVLLIAIAMLAAPLATFAVVPLVHAPIPVYQAYPGISLALDPANDSVTRCPERLFGGYIFTGIDPITSVPGILGIVPGVKYHNFVAAAFAGVPYTIKNVSLVKQTPVLDEGADVFPSIQVIQLGTPNIRLWWPLEYEVPGTTWTFTITYGTTSLYQDAGPGNPPSYVHTEVWQWYVNADVQSMSDELELFHEIAEGTNEVPLVSDEVLYPALQAKLSFIEENIDLGTEQGLLTAGETLVDFENEISDATITVSPVSPIPTGGDTGIIENSENPAAVKLLVDAEYVGKAEGIWFQVKR
jgi:hypothetical protein